MHVCAITHLLQIIILSLVRNSGGSEEDEAVRGHNPRKHVNIGFLRVSVYLHAKPVMLTEHTAYSLKTGQMVCFRVEQTSTRLN